MGGMAIYLVIGYLPVHKKNITSSLEDPKKKISLQDNFLLVFYAFYTKIRTILIFITLFIT